MIASFRVNSLLLLTLLLACKLSGEFTAYRQPWRLPCFVALSFNYHIQNRLAAPGASSTQASFEDGNIGVMLVFTDIDKNWGHTFLENKVGYAHRHGYKLSVYGHLESSLPPAWSKIVALRRLLHKHNYVWSIDM